MSRPSCQGMICHGGLSERSLVSIRFLRVSHSASFPPIGMEASLLHRRRAVSIMFAVVRVPLADCEPHEHSAFAFTTKQGSASGMREPLERLRHPTRLKSIQRVNLSRHRVEFATLRPR